MQSIVEGDLRIYPLSRLLREAGVRQFPKDKTNEMTSTLGQWEDQYTWLVGSLAIQGG